MGAVPAEAGVDRCSEGDYRGAAEEMDGRVGMSDGMAWNGGFKEE